MNSVFIIGSLNMDLVIKTPVFPKSGETVKGSGFMENCGGKGGNQAAAVAKLGGNARMVARVGRDGFGDQILRTLGDSGVDTRAVDRLKDKSTGVAFVLVENGDNRIVLDGGANDAIECGSVERYLKENAHEGDIALLQLEIPLDVVLGTLKTAKALGMTTVLNPAPARVFDAEYFRYVDYLIPNETELELLSGTGDVEEGVKRMLRLGVKNLIVTLGAEGSRYDGAEGSFFVPACRVKAVDTTAAGDTYIGAASVCLAKGLDIKTTMKFATRCASITVQRMGAMQSIPTAKELADTQDCSFVPTV